MNKYVKGGGGGGGGNSSGKQRNFTIKFYKRLDQWMHMHKRLFTF